MTDRFTLAQIRAFWTEQADRHHQSATASWSDRRVIELEIKEIVKRIADGDRVLDVGCANGYSTVQLAAARRVDVTGVDYIPEMIREARARLGADPALADRVRFDVGDITRLTQPDAAFDKVVVIRVLINLGAWDYQRDALSEALRTVTPGGLLLLSEATIQGWQRLNQFRREWELPDIAMPAFNQYLDEDRLLEAAASRADLVEAVHFSSTYYAMTRVIKPLLIQALGRPIDVADPEMEWNRWCAQLPAWGDYGVQRLFVFRKR